MLTPCLTALCPRQSNTPSHVVCCHGSKDPSRSVRKNIVLVTPPNTHTHTHTHTHTTPPTADEQSSSRKTFFSRVNIFCDISLDGMIAESSATLLGRVVLKTLFFSAGDTHSGMAFQITLTVIGRPKMLRCRDPGCGN